MLNAVKHLYRSSKPNRQKLVLHARCFTAFSMTDFFLLRTS